MNKVDLSELAAKVVERHTLRQPTGLTAEEIRIRRANARLDDRREGRIAGFPLSKEDEAIYRAILKKGFLH